MDSFELKEVIEKAQEIDKIIEEVPRPELKERLEKRWARAKYGSEANPERVLETIRKEKGLSQTRFKHVWDRMTSRLRQTKVGYPNDSIFREWVDGNRHYAHLLIWADTGPEPTPLVRVDYPREKFRDVEEADEFAASYGGYCSNMVTLQGVEYWCLFVKDTSKKVME